MLLHIYNGTLVAANLIQIRDENGISMKAELGETETVRVAIEDTSGTLDFVGYKSWRMVEDQCPIGAQTIWYGYVGRQALRRGPDRGLGTGVSVLWELDLVECNGWLSRRIYRPTDATANRPAETVSTRMTWFLASRACSGLIYDRGLVDASSEALDAADYRGRTGADVLRDMSLPTGFNFFVRYHDATATMELIFTNWVTSPDDVSGLTISNDLADITTLPGPPWSPSPSTTLLRDPDRVAGGVLVAYQGGSAYDTNATTVSTFADVDMVAPTASVKTKAKADSLVAHYLAQHDEQESLITDCHLFLPPANVRDVMHGQLVSAKFTHFSGWDTAKNWRVNSKRIDRFEQQGEAVYDVTLEMSPGQNLIYQDTFAELQRHVTKANPDGPNDYEVVFEHTGDTAESGWPDNPKYGRVTYEPVYVDAGAPQGVYYRGLTVTGAGTLDVEL